jgi:hypothetical protein
MTPAERMRELAADPYVRSTETRATLEFQRCSHENQAKWWVLEQQAFLTYPGHPSEEELLKALRNPAETMEATLGEMAVASYATAIIAAYANVAMSSIQGPELEAFIHECIGLYAEKACKLLRPASEDSASRKRIAHLVDLYSTTALSSIRVISQIEDGLKNGMKWEELSLLVPRGSELPDDDELEMRLSHLESSSPAEVRLRDSKQRVKSTLQNVGHQDEGNDSMRQGLEDQFNRALTDTLLLLKADGRVFENVRARVSDRRILIMDVDLVIEVGDLFVRTLPNGLADEFLVEDPGYQAGLPGLGMPSHFQVKVCKQFGREPNPGIFSPANRPEPVVLTHQDTEPRANRSADSSREWTELTLTFISDHRVNIQFTGAAIETRSYEEMGFGDGRGGKPRAAWESFRDLSGCGGEPLRIDKKRAQELRTLLRRHFLIQSDPLLFNRRQGYTTRFRIGRATSFES